MEAVLHGMPVQVPLWNAALEGDPDWDAIYGDCNSTVDWPTAGFVGELLEAFPSAKFILGHRSPESWADSFGATIYTLLAEKDQAPPEMKDWLDMAGRVIEKTGFPLGLDREGLISRFVAHNENVKATVPADQLLVFEAKEGWEPLCEFLGVPAPDGPFPRSNDRVEFWDRVSGKT